ncbi:hypothetical protein GQ53DRAFT_779076 [Thozetella sp. PMI_491]|nr:hypothetical protein GQ53DRAFT_779076 [Thozetella sp. PMI_491]
MAEQTDVLICGSGSAGLCAAVWLARCGVKYKVLEKRPGPLDRGQADGVQTRTVEIFESFGISENLLKESYHVIEDAFWASDGAGNIKRTNYAADTEPGLSHQPHVILNQARLNNLMIEEIKRSSGNFDIEYGVQVNSIEVDSSSSHDPDAFSITTTAVSNGSEKIYKSKYVLACDGAHSSVRKSLGFNMIGDTSDAVWGVMDIYLRTDFPDIRKKAVLNSDAGNLMIIPREGDSLVRFYIELGGTPPGDVTLEMLQEKARRIFHPFSTEFVETIWWSAYSIGQRLADFFHKDYKVFLMGDSCHTHSPKAGQGMNVSLQDGYNMGWKLAAVLKAQAVPAVIETYVSERQQTASDLVEFDRSWTKLFSTSYRQEQGITPEEFKNRFVKAGRYTAGQGIKYGGSLLISPDDDAGRLAGKLVVGMRFPSTQVVRLSDARAIQLVTAMPANSQWHLVVFSGDILKRQAAEALKKCTADLERIVQTFTPQHQDMDSVIQALLVLKSDRSKVEVHHVPSLFTPTTGRWKIKCLHKVFFDDESYNSGHGCVYDTYGIWPDEGCVVVVRPDHSAAECA